MHVNCQLHCRYLYLTHGCYVSLHHSLLNLTSLGHDIAICVCKLVIANIAGQATCHVSICMYIIRLECYKIRYNLTGIYSQGASSDGFPVYATQRAAPAPPAVLPRVAVAAAAPWQAPMPSWHANSSAVAPVAQQYGYEEQQAAGSQDSSSHFRFLLGQGSSQDSRSTPSLSNRSVPKFLEDSWAHGEPQQGATRQAQAPPVPPPPPGRTSLTLSPAPLCPCPAKQLPQTMTRLSIAPTLMSMSIAAFTIGVSSSQRSEHTDRHS